MKKKYLRILCITIIALFVIIGALVCTSILNSKASAVKQAQKSLEYICEKYANEFYSVFLSAQTIADNIVFVAEEDMNVSAYINERTSFEASYDKMDAIMESAIHESEYPIGLFFTFNPETSGGKDEIWYVKDKEDEVSCLDSLALSGDGWIEERSEANEYYYRAIEDGASWSDAGYDPGMDGETITYSRAVYDSDDRLVGVVGVDILVDDIFNSLQIIDEDISGSSALIDANGELVSGTLTDVDTSGKERIYAQAKISDNLNIELMQPVDIAISPILQAERLVIIMGIITALAVAGLLIYIARRKVEPVIREFEEKDTIMLAQARQAKMGEMVGSIAHQFKQPLNSMKMAVSNMQEDHEQNLLSEADFDSYTDRVFAMINNLTEMVDNFTHFLRPTKKSRMFSVNDEIENVLKLMQERIVLEKIDVAIEGREIYAQGSSNEFAQCIFNLLDNGIDALKEESETPRCIKINTYQDTDKDGRAYNVIRIFNNGKPIEDEYADKLFELYFTTKGEEEGSGIGLYLTRQIIEMHFSGKVYFENERDGVAFYIKLPADDRDILTERI